MKIKQARRALNRSMKVVDKETQDKFLKSLKAPIWVRILSWVEPTLATRWTARKVAAFKIKHEAAMKKATKKTAKIMTKMPKPMLSKVIQDNNLIRKSKA